ncbi:Glycosyl transferase group 1 [Hyella patelloides LEGE 07179]|uniref:Glycosyl transferase group 1 n=1 Tax=Hyella patelloides LEGE 07179 TaxID=945734 RepID=A0A563VMP7_9CYAN|nr:glycosyltransferase [Hyella patelloides]VEP12691.1 Glycosyl transferase group 1 [Hyella patelloides LEGE 07179]
MNKKIFTNDTQFQKPDLEKKRHNQERKLILFDLSIYGHHPAYIQYLVQYWCEQELPGSLDIIVSPRFLQVHAEVVDTALSYGQKNVNFVEIAPAEEAALKPRNSIISRTHRAWQEWQLLCKYVDCLGANHCLIMYFDPYQLPLALGIKTPCPFSGIYFRPTFHYHELANYEPKLKERIQQWRERLLISQIVNHPQLQNLFCLDPFAIAPLAQFCRHSQAIHLPDPVPSVSCSLEEITKLKFRLSVEPQRQVFLLFGALTKRKGIYQVLEAVRLLPSFLCQHLCILMVGQVDRGVKTQVESLVADLHQETPIQIIRHYQFVSETEVSHYFQLADVVLATYQRHVGMSGILLLAAAAQKPVLADSYGLMGEITRQHQLGLTVDATKAAEIAQGITQILSNPEAIGDRNQMKQMKQFAAQNSPQRFARTILQHI